MERQISDHPPQYSIVHRIALYARIGHVEYCYCFNERRRRSKSYSPVVHEYVGCLYGANSIQKLCNISEWVTGKNMDRFSGRKLSTSVGNRNHGECIIGNQLTSSTLNLRGIRGYYGRGV